MILDGTCFRLIWYLIFTIVNLLTVSYRQILRRFLIENMKIENMTNDEVVINIEKKNLNGPMEEVRSLFGDI